MNPSLHAIEEFLSALGRPDYGHLFLEPVFVYGLGLGLLTFLYALLVREQKMQLFGLIIIAASAMMIGPYLQRRGAAQKHIVRVYQIDQPGRASGFVDSTNRRRQTRWIYYLTAGVAIGTLLVGASKNKVGIGFVVATILLTVGTIILSGYNHYEEAKLYHPTLRAPPGPSQYLGDELR